jgi:hypothetical protein
MPPLSIIIVMPTIGTIMQIGFLVQQKGFRNIGGHMKAGRKETVMMVPVVAQGLLLKGLEGLSDRGMEASG